jgi:hypothetical protein
MSRTIDGTFGVRNADPLQVRPFNFGTDAIERQRVSLGQSIIDADFEYGLQGTKWQNYQEVRKCPSFYEISGTDQYVSHVTVDGATPTVATVFLINLTNPTNSTISLTGAIGVSSTTLTINQNTVIPIGSYIVGIPLANIVGPIFITGNTSATSYTASFPSQTTTSGSGLTFAAVTALPPTLGSVINVSGLYNVEGTADSAMGFFFTTSNVTSSNSFTYTCKIKSVAANTISTYSTVVRRGGILNNGNAKIPASSISFAQPQVGGNTVVTITTTAAHGLVPGTPIVSNAITATTTIGNVNGSYFVDTVPSATTFTYNAASTTTSGTLSLGSVYVQPYSYTVHRPFDGGVLLATGQPANGSSVMRQSKKVFRYQSGKGLLWSSGTLFCPNNDISALTASGTTVGSTITVTTSIPHGAPQQGAIVQIRGVTTSGYNGTYTVASVVTATQLTLTATQVLGSTTPVLGNQPRFIMTNWHGSSVRAGCFEDQNGLFWEYDGQTLWIVKRSSTFQLAGLVYCALNAQTLTGVATRFQDQLKAGDKFTIRGMTHFVTSITSQTSLTFNPPYRGAVAITAAAPVQACKVIELRVPQSQFNRDPVDGTGVSGFKVDLSKMQMLGIQYTWYGAGFADFMIRGGDGNWVYAHRFRNNNVNDEAYMRTGNMPVRYEIVNESLVAASTLSAAMDNSQTFVLMCDDTTYWPSNGTVMVDNELIFYGNKSSNSLTNCTRSATLNYNVADVNKQFTGTAATTHTSNTSVNLVSCTCAPSLTHWGSAFIMDGQFDSDRGYFFNFSNIFYTAGSSVTAGTSNPAFFLRLSPSVSNGIIGDIGTRDLLNRAQLLLQQMDVAPAGVAGGCVNIVGILNPSGFENSTFNWQAVNSTVNGSQPSFAQFAYPPPTGTYVPGTGERVFSTLAQYGSLNSLNLANLKEISNSVIGGNRIFPDGPDTLLILVQPLNTALSNCVVNLYWSEAQA